MDMRIYDAQFAASLVAARDGGIAPVYFFWVLARPRAGGAEVPIGLWSGDEDITLTLTQPDGSAVSRHYFGGVNLRVEDLTYVGDLTDNPVAVSTSQGVDAAQLLARGYDLRLAYCEIHATTMTGGAFTAAPQLQWVGIIDAGPINTPGENGEGGITYQIRSEIMWQLTARNPAKSSDAHQKRRNPIDRFCEFAAVIGSRSIQWYKKDR